MLPFHPECFYVSGIFLFRTSSTFPFHFSFPNHHRGEIIFSFLILINKPTGEWRGWTSKPERYLFVSLRFHKRKCKIIRLCGEFSVKTRALACRITFLVFNFISNIFVAIAFMGYVLPFGQMSFWGATVITNLLSPFPSLIEWVCGGHYVYNPTLKRFFVFHFQFPFFLCGFRILHLFYLHFHSSNNPLRLNTNNKIPFFPFIFLKDFFGFILILCLYLLQTHFGISSFSHPDNALEVCGLLTPLHIVPEWYFVWIIKDLMIK